MKSIHDFLQDETTIEMSKVCPKHNCYYVKPSPSFLRVFSRNLPKNILEGWCPECLEEGKKNKLHEFNDEVFFNNTRGYLKRNSLIKNKAWFNCTFDNFKVNVGDKNNSAQLKFLKRQAHKLSSVYFEEPEREFNSLFFGNTGAGKTHLAMAILNGVSSASQPPQKCLFISLNKLIDKRLAYQQNEQNNSWSADYTQKLISNADLVVIDDLGAESPTRVATNFTQLIINQVYDSNPRIITTTNMTLSQLKETYEPRIISRVLAGANGSMLDFSKIRDYRFWNK